MHLLNTYATSTGSKIEKPFIYTSFFPVPDEKYITFQAQTKSEAKDYSFWQDVINMIFPVVSKYGIKIIQVGGDKEKPYQYAVDFRGKTNINQLAYVIQHSCLHIGSDSLCVHLASGFDIPLVALYSTSPKTVSGPIFNKSEKQIIFESYLRMGNQKSSFSNQENPKSVNLIRPEEIANAVFKQMGLEFELPLETIYVGEKYGYDKIRDFIPNNVVQLFNPEIPVEIRMDIEFNENILAQQLSIGKGIIITDKPINLNLLKQFKPNIPTLIYEVKENDNPEFIVAVKKIGIPSAVITYLPVEKLESKKIHYYEHGKINVIKNESQEAIDILKKDIDNLYYRSNKIILSNNKFYLSNAARAKDIDVKSDFDYQKVIDAPEFWQELNYMHIVKKVK